MNSCNFTGRIASDPEHRTTQSGVAVCNFRLAVNRSRKESDGTRKADFISIVAWRQSAEYISRFLKKGDAVAVRGALQVRQYTAQDGSARYATEIQADSVESIGNRAADQNAQTATETPAQDDGFVEVDDEELPF